ncbi:MAG: cell division protein CrgA [Acidimicrobiales bacterium]|nr:cell division protein CrgA [Acidimicrobiales bacterium]
MGKPPKRRVQGGRVTPKGGAPVASSRYTPPGVHAAAANKVSPPWVAVVMFALLGIGIIVIILNYLDVLPGGTSNWYLLMGLGAILGGIITATQYH